MLAASVGSVRLEGATSYFLLRRASPTKYNTAATTIIKTIREPSTIPSHLNTVFTLTPPLFNLHTAPLFYRLNRRISQNQGSRIHTHANPVCIFVEWRKTKLPRRNAWGVIFQFLFFR